MSEAQEQKERLDRLVRYVKALTKFVNELEARVEALESKPSIETTT